MKIHLHELVYRRLCEVAASQGKTKKRIVQESLVRNLGLEGIPIPDDEVYGEAQKAEAPNSQQQGVASQG